MVPDEEHYIEKPLGESFFPAPSVGYSRVEVKNLQYSNVTQHATGKVIQEFYTAKDFPTLVDWNGVDVKHKSPDFWAKMFKSSTRDLLTASQGYVIENNDMHGKPKAQYIYAEGAGNYQSGVEYKYKTRTETINTGSSSTTGPKRVVLDNNVKVLFADNTIHEREIGVEYDMINDFRESKTKSKSGGLDINSDSFLAGILPFWFPTIYPSFKKYMAQYRAAVTTKVINRFAILDETIAYDNSSTIRTKNTLWMLKQVKYCLQKWKINMTIRYTALPTLPTWLTPIWEMPTKTSVLKKM